MKAFKRLSIDPLTVYGTLCIKSRSATRPGGAGCVARVDEEIAIVQPKIVVIMGEDALKTLNELYLPLTRPISNSRASYNACPRRSTRSMSRTDSSLDEE